MNSSTNENNNINNPVIKEFMENETVDGNDFVEITPDDDLELYSPLEKLTM